ncbi:MAG TPA: ABC transporter permease, partial [Clostridia bacterium]|nr:ABC transporter permease [Clostridia bacterium]
MYVKLALRNVKRSAKDYLIYVMTMVLSVGLFYGFLSITSPIYNSKLPIQMNLAYFSGKMKIIIPLIALLLVFLISYVNHYMIKQRKKEFALQIIMGMEQATVAYLFFIEMLIMGTIAVVLGILLGTLLSQIVSAIIMASFGENYQFYFSIFPDTIIWTLGFFSSLFIVIGIGNVRVIRKQKIIDMLHDSQKTESGLTIKEMLSKSLVVGALLAIGILYLNLKGIFPFWEKLNVSARASIAFCIAATILFLFLVVSFFITVSIANEKVNFIAAMLSVSSTVSGILLLRTVSIFNELVINGVLKDIYIIAPTLFAAGMLLFGIISFFACLSWFISLAKKKSVKLKYKHLFLLGQLGSKMNTNANTMSVLSCILISSLVLLGWVPT